MRKFSIVSLTVFILFSSAIALNYSGFSSLKITPSARECAMGGTGVISGLGPQSMYYNPSLTSELKSFAVNINYAKWFLDMYEQSIFAVRPLPYFNLGLGIVSFNAGDLDFRPDYPTEDPNGYFNPNDFNFFLNISKMTTRGQSRAGFGISGRFFYQKIYEYTATGIGADAGLSLHLLPNFSFGFSIIDFGTSMKFIREDFSLPTKFLTGINYNINLKNISSAPKVKMTSDLGYLFYDKKLNLNCGAELSFSDKYFLRTGYKFGETINHYNLGFGLIVKSLRIEYAFSPNNLELSNTHHISLSLGY